MWYGSRTDGERRTCEWLRMRPASRVFTIKIFVFGLTGIARDKQKHGYYAPGAKPQQIQ